MRARKSSLCVLFADITDSTGHYAALGDEAGRELVLDCFERMMLVVEAHGGTTVERIGDELLCTFPDAGGAARASCELHRAVEAANQDRPVRLSIRIGFHCGSVLLDGDHIYGDTIHVARRVASLAKPQQSLTTGITKSSIPPKEPVVTRFVDRTPLKGKAGTFELFEIVWDEGAATANAEADEIEKARRPMADLLELVYGDRIVTLDATQRVVTLGRDPRADLVFKHEKVSRLHARIEQRRDRFVLVDQSTNGSRVIQPGEPPRFLLRDECTLGSSGSIVLGPFDRNADYPSLGFRRRSPGIA